jgi:hypothetical protein
LYLRFGPLDYEELCHTRESGYPEALKYWIPAPRLRGDRLIEEVNPEWKDLFDTL